MGCIYIDSENTCTIGLGNDVYCKYKNEPDELHRCDGYDSDKICDECGVDINIQECKCEEVVIKPYITIVSHGKIKETGQYEVTIVIVFPKNKSGIMARYRESFTTTHQDFSYFKWKMQNMSVLQAYHHIKQTSILESSKKLN